MKGMVFSGFEVPSLKGYDVVVYLMKGVGVFEKMERMCNLYHYMISDWNSPYFESFMSNLGITDKDEIYDLMVSSKFDFISFVELASKEYPKIHSISAEMAGFLKVFKILARREKCSVIVGDSSNGIIKSYFKKLLKDQVTVVDGIKYFFSKSDHSNCFVAIDGNSLFKFKPHYISPGTRFFITNNKSGCYLPPDIDPLKYPVYMTEDIAEGTTVVGSYPIIF